MKSLSILIYEDNDNFRDGLSQFVAATPGLDLVGAFADCRDVAEHVRLLRPDLVLTDIEMPHVDGISGMNIVKSQYPEVKVLILTHFDDDEKIFRAMIEGGADGYLIKDASPEKIREAIQDVMTNGAPMSPYIAKRALQLAKEMSSSASFFPWQKTAPDPLFTETEHKVLGWLSKGHSKKMIAAELDISINTVKTHLKRVYEKMQVRSAPEAVAKAIRERWV
jgi:DNA-binding NarL/FixJ family response regulator